MKKKIFTLIRLGFLLSGMVFTAMAQDAKRIREDILPPTTIGNKGYSDYDQGIYSNCNYTVRFLAGSEATNFVLSLWGTYTDADGSPKEDSLTAYLSVPAIPKVAAWDSTDITYYIKDLPAKYRYVRVLAHPGDQIPVGGGSSFSTSIYLDIGNCHNYPQIALKYEAPSPGYAGKAELSIVGGSPWLQYSLGNGKWEFVYTEGARNILFTPNADSIIPFTPTQISNFPDVIYFKEPHTPRYSEIIIRGEEYPVVPITPRLVTIPTISGATLSPSGKHYVESGGNFELTVTVSDPATEPKLSTTPKELDADREYLGDGVYKYTIKRITKATNIHIELVPAGISPVEGSSVWSASGQIYVTAATAASTHIYGATGATVKQVALGAGETTSVSLPAGFYIVTLNGSVYKVILK
jgi:hypothetical protein